MKRVWTAYVYDAEERTEWDGEMPPGNVAFQVEESSVCVWDPVSYAMTEMYRVLKLTEVVPRITPDWTEEVEA